MGKYAGKLTIIRNGSRQEAFFPVDKILYKNVVSKK